MAVLSILVVLVVVGTSAWALWDARRRLVDRDRWREGELTVAMEGDTTIFAALSGLYAGAAAALLVAPLAPGLPLPAVAVLAEFAALAGAVTHVARTDVLRIDATSLHVRRGYRWWSTPLSGITAVTLEGLENDSGVRSVALRVLLEDGRQRVVVRYSAPGGPQVGTVVRWLGKGGADTSNATRFLTAPGRFDTANRGNETAKKIFFAPLAAMCVYGVAALAVEHLR